MAYPAAYDAENIATEQLKTAIFEFIRDYDPVSFPEILQKIPQAKGDVWFIHNPTNIVFWIGLSQAAYDAIKSLVDEGIVFPRETDTIRVMVDGALNLPLAKQINRKYQEPHWLPVLLTLKDPRVT